MKNGEVCLPSLHLDSHAFMGVLHKTRKGALKSRGIDKGAKTHTLNIAADNVEFSAETTRVVLMSSVGGAKGHAQTGVRMMGAMAKGDIFLYAILERVDFGPCSVG